MNQFSASIRVSAGDTVVPKTVWRRGQAAAAASTAHGTHRRKPAGRVQRLADHTKTPT